MPKHLVIEEEKSPLPPFLIVDTNSGIQNKLLDLLAASLSNKLKIYSLTGKKVTEEVSVISPLSIHFLDRLSEDLRYTLIFLDEESQKKKTIEIAEKLTIKGTRILILIPYRICEKFIDVIINSKDKKNISFGLVGDLFGESHLSSPISKLISNAVQNKEIVISGNELLPIFPISESDLINAIQSALFSKNKDYIYSFFYDHPQTLLSMAHLLKRIEPELSISFNDEKPEILQSRTQEQKDRYFKDRVNSIPKKISNLLGFEKSVEQMQHKIPTPESKKTFILENKKKRKTGKRAKRIFSALVYGFALYLLVTFVLFFLSLVVFKEGVRAAADGRFSSSAAYFSSAKKLFNSSKITVEAAASVPILFSNTYLYDNLNAYESVLDDAPDILQTAKKLSEESALSQNELEESFASVFQLYFLSERYNLTELYKSLEFKDQDTFSKFITLFNVLPDVLGFEKPKNYILLFQNNNELRPTGGFIGSVGYLTVKSGKVDNISVNDVYDLDGQLKGHIEPYFVIRRYLQPHLYLRDSNFSPNFEESASSAALLYNLETGKRANGIIALDTFVLKTLMKITGPMNIPGGGEINSDNVVDLVQNSIKENNFPGSTQKRDILNKILNKIIITLEDPQKRVKFFKVLPQLITEKHILFAFSTNSVNKAFSAAGFTSNLSDNRVGKNILKDILGINEANIGVNKANEFLEREVSDSIYLNADKLNSEVTINYKNKDKDDYKAYLRLIVPASSEVISISVDGIVQDIVPAVTDPNVYEKNNFTPPSGLEVNQELSDDKKIIGFLINVPGHKESSVKINFQNTSIIPDEGSFTYSLLYIKQPGTNNYPLTVTLSSDNSYKIGKSAALFNTDIKADSTFESEVRWTRAQ